MRRHIVLFLCLALPGIVVPTALAADLNPGDPPVVLEYGVPVTVPAPPETAPISTWLVVGNAGPDPVAVWVGHDAVSLRPGEALFVDAQAEGTETGEARVCWGCVPYSVVPARATVYMAVLGYGPSSTARLQTMRRALPSGRTGR